MGKSIRTIPVYIETHEEATRFPKALLRRTRKESRFLQGLESKSLDTMTKTVRQLELSTQYPHRHLLLYKYIIHDGMEAIDTR